MSLLSSNYSLAILGLILTNLFWSSNAVLARFIVEDIPPFTLVFVRWLLALLILLPFTWRDIVSNFGEVRRCWQVIIVLGVFGVSIYNSGLYLAAHSTTAINMTLVSSTLPLVTIAASSLLLGIIPTRWQLLGIIASFTGVMFIITQGKLSQLLSVNLNQGDLLVLVITCCWALYSVILKKYPVHLKPTSLLTILIAVGLPPLFGLFLLEQSLANTPLLQMRHAPIYLYAAIFPSILAYLFWGYSVIIAGPNIASLSCYLIPLFTVVMAVPLLKESLHSYHLIGAALMLVGLYFGSLFKST